MIFLPSTKAFMIILFSGVLLITIIFSSFSNKQYFNQQLDLAWQFCSAGMNSRPWGCRNEPLLLNWQQALNYCSRLNLAQHDDWRLPSRNELITLVDWNTRVPATHSKLIASTKNNVYWSATSFPDDPQKAYYTSMFSGYSYANFKTVQGYVRCVRKLG